jgi:Niemann-Pick C1 protein
VLASSDVVNSPETLKNAFTYSLYFVYYDQYTYIEGVLTQNVLLAIAGVAMALQVLNSLGIALIVTLCVFLIMFELMGTMWMLNLVLGGYPIEMNAVLVVNLITSLGLGVEFCNHVGMSFMRQKGTKEARARKALAEMGSSVLVGIASTKFIGVIVLAFAPSTIFKLYYFRMYLFIIFLGCFNGLMLLPLLLKYVGPPPDKSDLKDHANTLREYEVLRIKSEKRKAGDNGQY